MLTKPPNQRKERVMSWDRVDIKDVGIFEVKRSSLHREGGNIYTYDKGIYGRVQFDNYNKLEKGYQKGYALNKGFKEIYLKLIP